MVRSYGLDRGSERGPPQIRRENLSPLVTHDREEEDLAAPRPNIVTHDPIVQDRWVETQPTSIEAAGIAADRKGWLFRIIDRERVMTIRPMHRSDALRMIKKRAKTVGLPEAICCHTFRATGITAYLENGVVTLAS
jgi:integrase